MTDNQILEQMGHDIMELTEERDRYKADADRLAVALKDIAEYNGDGRINAPWQQIVKSIGYTARAALAAHEEGKQ